jgi:NADPH-dependent curcumin reductase CurA
MSETCRAIQLERFASSFREATDIVTLPLDQPGPGEIRVRNRFCGVNALFDTQLARNNVGFVSLSLPSFTGVEALGVVDAVGEGVAHFRPGDAAISFRFTGGYREANIGPAESFIKVPGVNPDWLVLSSTGVAALIALEQIAELKDGETVAISAAAGGLGHLLVQLALLRGCHVIGVAGGTEKCAFVAALGAQRVIDYKSEDVAAVLAAEYPGGIDVAIDTVSGAIHDAFLANLAVRGRLIISGAASDQQSKPELVTAPRIADAIYTKGASVRAFMNSLMTEHWPEARAKLFALYDQGKLKVYLDERRFVGLDSIYDAVEHHLSGRSIGKVIAEIGTP